MLTIFSSQNAATSALTAITVMLGAMSLGGTAQATESNPLLGGAAGTVVLSSAQMESVEGSGRLSDYHGKLGVDNAKKAWDTGRYALYKAKSDSRDQYRNYYKAADYAKVAAAHYKKAGDLSHKGSHGGSHRGQ